MSKIPEPYKIADKAIKQLNRTIVREFDQATDKMLIAGFDELNVIGACKDLYADIDKAARKKYQELFVLRYRELFRWLSDNRYTEESVPDEDTIEQIAELHIASLLWTVNPITRYAWDTEILRKRDRATEAVNAVSGKGNKQEELAKHRRYVAAQAGYYADLSSQEAELQAYKDSGVRLLVRHEENDEKTCIKCLEADGRVYPIDKIPPIPHLHCRRWFTPK